MRTTINAHLRLDDDITIEENGKWVTIDGQVTLYSPGEGSVEAAELLAFALSRFIRA